LRIIEITAPILTKFCTVTKTTYMGGPNSRKTSKMADGRHFENILPRNLVCW